MTSRWWLWFLFGALTGGLGLWVFLAWHFRSIYR